MSETSELVEALEEALTSLADAHDILTDLGRDDGDVSQARALIERAVRAAT